MWMVPVRPASPHLNDFEGFTTHTVLALPADHALCTETLLQAQSTAACQHFKQCDVHCVADAQTLRACCHCVPSYVRGSRIERCRAMALQRFEYEHLSALVTTSGTHAWTRIACAQLARGGVQHALKEGDHVENCEHELGPLIVIASYKAPDVHLETVDSHALQS